MSESARENMEKAMREWDEARLEAQRVQDEYINSGAVIGILGTEGIGMEEMGTANERERAAFEKYREAQQRFMDEQR